MCGKEARRIVAERKRAVESYSKEERRKAATTRRGGKL